MRFLVCFLIAFLCAPAQAQNWQLYRVPVGEVDAQDRRCYTVQEFQSIAEVDRDAQYFAERLTILERKLSLANEEIEHHEGIVELYQRNTLVEDANWEALRGLAGQMEMIAVMLEEAERIERRHNRRSKVRRVLIASVAAAGIFAFSTSLSAIVIR